MKSRRIIGTARAFTASSQATRNPPISVAFALASSQDDGLDVRVSFLIVLWQAHDEPRLPDCRWVRKQLSRYVVAVRGGSRDAAEPFDGLDVRMSFLIVLWQAHDEPRLPDCRWVREQLSRYVVAVRSGSRDAAEPFHGLDV